jgi:hypothetical protein
MAGSFAQLDKIKEEIKQKAAPPCAAFSSLRGGNWKSITSP